MQILFRFPACLSSTDFNSMHFYFKVQQSCGVASASGTGLVHGGERFIRGAWPWMVALVDQKTSYYFCSGTFVSEKRVLTGE